MVMLRAQTDLLHHGLHFFATFAGAQVGVDQQRLSQLITHFLPRVERGVWALEHHLHVFAQLLALGLVGPRDFLTGNFQ